VDAQTQRRAIDDPLAAGEQREREAAGVKRCIAVAVVESKRKAEPVAEQAQRPRQIAHRQQHRAALNHCALHRSPPTCSIRFSWRPDSRADAARASAKPTTLLRGSEVAWG